MKSIKNSLLILGVLIISLYAQGFKETSLTYKNAGITEAQLKKVDFDIRKMIYSGLTNNKRLLKPSVVKEGNAVIKQKENGLFISALIKSENPQFTKQEVESNGGEVSNIIKDILVVDLPVNRLKDIVFNDDILFIESSKYQSSFMDTSLTFINIDKVHQGIGLPKAYKGQDVIVGIVDSGIDWTHPAFSNENGNRILYLWDTQPVTMTNPPSQFDYGNEFTKEDLDQQNANTTDENGHGTHVASTAAGNYGGEDYPLVGVAPESDIIFVRLGTDLSNNNIINACDYIIKKSRLLNKPVVINLSLGFVNGSTGTSLFEEAISSLVEPGKLIVAAAGNSGRDNNTIHLQYTMFGSTLDDKINTRWRILDSTKELTSILGYPNSDKFNIGIQVLDSNKDPIYTSPTVSYNQEISDFVIVNSDTIAHLALSAKSTINEPYLFDIKLEYPFDSAAKNYIFNFFTYGSAFFNAWINNGLFYSLSDITQNVIGGDNLMTVGSPSSAFNVFSIGAFSSKLSWTDINGDFNLYNGTIKGRAPFSSIGPLRDGRIKPDFMAPGHFISAAYSIDAAYPDHLVISDYIVNMAGTSMSAPHFTGVLALMLEQKPDLTYQEAYDILKNTSITDELTGAVPNNEYGWGRIDAHAALQQLITSVEDLNEIPSSYKLSHNYPNPFNPTTSIEYAVPNNEFVSLKVYDILGNEIAELVNEQKSAGTYRVSFDASRLSSGVYFYSIKAGSFNQVGKMLLLK